MHIYQKVYYMVVCEVMNLFNKQYLQFCYRLQYDTKVQYKIFHLQ
jgi:hypothetical protein